jgi:hypothetical protein
MKCSSQQTRKCNVVVTLIMMLQVTDLSQVVSRYKRCVVERDGQEEEDPRGLRRDLS